MRKSMAADKDASITSELLGLFEETFEKVHGSYLDRGTSFLETLASVDWREASRKRGAIKETIAAHVNHVVFYVVVLQEYITGERTGKTDWSLSWLVEAVDETGWAELVGKLESEYRKLRDFIESVEEWGDADRFGGILSILAHCSYHLGAVRQLIDI
jgi:hypothetical protein